MQGVSFLDIFPLLRDPLAFETLITHFLHHIMSHTIPKSVLKKVDVVVGLDARGFLLGPIIALRLGAAFVPIRKKGKLPGPCTSVTYEKEYGPVSVISPYACMPTRSRTLIAGRIRLKCNEMPSGLAKMSSLSTT